MLPHHTRLHVSSYMVSHHKVTTYHITWCNIPLRPSVSSYMVPHPTKQVCVKPHDVTSRKTPLYQATWCNSPKDKDLSSHIASHPTGNDTSSYMVSHPIRHHCIQLRGVTFPKALLYQATWCHISQSNDVPSHMVSHTIR